MCDSEQDIIEQVAEESGCVQYATGVVNSVPVYLKREHYRDNKGKKRWCVTARIDDNSRKRKTHLTETQSIEKFEELVEKHDLTISSQ